MEEVNQRFPLIAQKILSNVDNESLINFKEAGRNNAKFLEKERFYWIRIIQSYNCLIGECKEVWNEVVSKTPIEIIKKLAVAVHQFPSILSRELHNENECFCNETGKIRLSPLDFVQTVEKQWHPLFIGATSGSVNLCNHIIQKAGVVKDPMLLNLNFWFGKITPIVFAYRRYDIIEDVNVFKFLLEKAEDKNPMITTRIKWTLLHSLAEKDKSELCRLIVEKIKDVNPQDIYGNTPYHIAALHGHVEVCRVLMEYLTDKNIKDNNGYTPFCIAASYGHLEVCRLFMETCVNKNHVDDFLRVPLHMAAWNGHVEVVGLFMANLVDKNIRENVGQKTPLLTAILGGHLNVCKLLIKEYKADVNLSDDYGMTPLHLACKLGWLEICKFLCKHASLKNTLDHYGKTPYDLAVSEAKWDIVAFLKCSLFSLKDNIKKVSQDVKENSGPNVNLCSLLSAACISSAEFSCWEGTPAARRGLPTCMENNIMNNDIMNKGVMDNNIMDNDTIYYYTVNNETMDNDIMDKDIMDKDIMDNVTVDNYTVNNDTVNNDTMDNDTMDNDTVANDTMDNDTMDNDNMDNDNMDNNTMESVQQGIAKVTERHSGLASNVVSSVKVQPNDLKYKTAICGSWKINGTCNQASDCIYAHGQCDIYQIKDIVNNDIVDKDIMVNNIMDKNIIDNDTIDTVSNDPVDNDTMDNDIMYKDTMDNDTMEKDKECVQQCIAKVAERRYGLASNAMSSMEVQAHDPKYKTAICGSWKINGTCNQASDCIYAHGQCDFYQINDNRKLGCCPNLHRT